MNSQMKIAEFAWYLVQCKARQDERAREHLLRQGFGCFCPTMDVETIKQGKLRRLCQPMFPGYLFIHLHAQDNWTALRSTRGVSRIVSFAGQPCRVSDDIVRHLMQRCATTAESSVLRPGDKVHVKVGPYAEMDAIFVSIDGEERVMLLLNILNREQQVRVPLSHLVA